MSENTSSKTATETSIPAAAAVTDPADLADHPAVEFRTRSFTHESPDHCEHEARGRAIVGVTDEDGSLLLCVRNEGDHAILPNDIVDDGEDWTTVARQAVEDALGVAVDLDGPVRVCRVDHSLDDDTHLETTYHVVFSGSHPVDGDRDEPAIQCDDDWEAVWTDELPAGLEQADGSVREDIQLFLDPDGDRPTADERDSTSNA